MDPDLASMEAGRRRNPGYYDEIDLLHRHLIPRGSRVLELGCGTGRLLAGLQPASGLGVDLDPGRIAAARELHRGRPELQFRTGNAESIRWGDAPPFDHVVLSDLLPLLNDVQKTLHNLRPVCHDNTRLVLNFHSNLWRPLMSLAVLLGLREEITDHNWLSTDDVVNLLGLCGFEPVARGGRVLLPIKVPLLHGLANRLLAKLPLLRKGCLSAFVVARPAPDNTRARTDQPPSVSIVVPTRNERGNIAELFDRTPVMGSWTELVFIDGHSGDGTVEEIERCRAEQGERWRRVAVLRQDGRGKGDAVKKAFAECRGDILMILDSDLTMPPEELPKYYEAIVSGRGELINGCRLVYPMEDRAMRFSNMVGNHFFGLALSYLLNQRVKDALCGTKVLWRGDYEVMTRHGSRLAEMDPFGDFALLFGAARLGRKIVDLPIRYRNRNYGETKISRWGDGLKLLRMTAAAFFEMVEG